MRKKNINNKSQKINTLFSLVFILFANILFAQTTPPPNGDNSQYFCSQASWANGGITVAQGDVLTDLNIKGLNLTWYEDNAGNPGNVIVNPANEVLIDNNTYYVTQTVNGVESSPLSVTVTDRECGCIRNTTFETQDNQPNYDGYTFYSQTDEEGHRTCGGSTVGAPTIPPGDSEATIFSTGTDSEVVTTNLSTTNPNNPNSQYALRLNDPLNGKVTHAAKEFIAGEVFVFNFSMVLDNPSNEHTYEELPHFQVRVYDEFGNLYADRCIISQPTDCIFNVGDTQLLYSEWTCVKINTLGIIGRKAKVEFTATDCTLDGHMGYAYIDDLFVGDEEDSNCSDPAFGYVAIESLENNVNSTGGDSCVIGNGSTVQVACSASQSADALPFPLEVCGSYVLPQSQGQDPQINVFTLDIIQNNSIVGSLSNPVLDPTNGTFCFTVEASDVNVAPYGDFNFEAFVEFALDCGVPQSVPIDDRSSIDVCPEAGCPSAISACDDTGTGIGTFDLTQASSQIISRWSSNDLSISYFEDQDDALSNTGAISNPNSYNNTNPGDQLIFARIDWNPNGVTGSSCFYLVEIDLVVDPLPELNNDPDNIYYCDPSVSISENLIATPLNITELEDVGYTWYKNGVQIPHTSSYYRATEPGTYTYTVSNYGCETTKTVEISMVDIEVDFDDDTIYLCDENSYTLSPNIIDNSNPSIAQSDLQFEWFDDNGVIQGENNQTLNISSSGNYYVEVSYEDCMYMASISVIFSNSPSISLGEDLTICSQDSEIITANISNFSDISSLEFEWRLDGDIINGEKSQSIEINQEGSYTVTVSEIGIPNCFSEDTVEVFYYANENCVITEGLSPDSTPGQNDCLDLEFLADRTGIDNIKLYSRYGRLVFEQNDYVNTFCGQTMDGDELPTGTYYYVLVLENEDPIFGNVVKGWIYINREAN